MFVLTAVFAASDEPTLEGSKMLTIAYRLEQPHAFPGLIVCHQSSRLRMRKHVFAGQLWRVLRPPQPADRCIRLVVIWPTAPSDESYYFRPRTG